MFAYTITANRVHDRVRFSEGGEGLTLRVDDDPDHIVAGLNEATKLLKAIENVEDAEKAALFFAKVLFGEEQAKKLIDFYFNDSGCIIQLLSRYFEERLSKKIMEAQKRRRK